MPDLVAPEFIALQQALAGRYSLERELGRGGMGMVFLARDVALDRPVAIKLLPKAMAAQPAFRERFLREAQTAAKLSHPNIVPIYAVEQVADFVFFVMAYVEGETLAERVRAKGPMTPREATKLLQEVAWALAYAHLRGIVHRDVKPDNILEAGTGRALVTDFGIARRAEAGGGTAVGEVLGTAHYMSPEQASGEPVDGRSDLYSLGVVGFFALSGRLPFEAPEVPALLAMQITKPAPPLASVAPGVPRRLAQAMDRCLAKDPEQRLPTGEALAETIALSTEPKHDLPVPLRVWLVKGDALKIGYVLWYMPVGMFVFAGVAAALGGIDSAGGMAAGLATYYFGPLVFHGLYRLGRLRRLLAGGYGLDDVRAAVRDVAERKREELTFEFGHEPALLARVIRAVTFTSFGVMIATILGRLLGTIPRGFEEGPMLWSALAGCVGLLISRGFPGKKVTRDFASELRLKFWSSRFGRWLTKLAGFGLKHPALPAEGIRRPTELAIGLAADALFESLPKETRKELKDLPLLVRRLEADAQATRARVEELSAMLDGLGAEDPAARSASLAHADGPAGAVVAGGRQKLREDLVAQRDAAARRLAASVAALENIRLDLLRLKAGVGTADQLSADLSAARDLQAEIEFAIEARRETEAVLRRGDAAAAPPPA